MTEWNSLYKCTSLYRVLCVCDCRMQTLLCRLHTVQLSITSGSSAQLHTTQYNSITAAVDQLFVYVFVEWFFKFLSSIPKNGLQRLRGSCLIFKPFAERFSPKTRAGWKPSTCFIHLDFRHSHTNFQQLDFFAGEKFNLILGGLFSREWNKCVCDSEKLTEKRRITSWIFQRL